MRCSIFSEERFFPLVRNIRFDKPLVFCRFNYDNDQFRVTVHVQAYFYA